MACGKYCDWPRRPTQCASCQEQRLVTLLPWYGILAAISLGRLAPGSSSYPGQDAPSVVAPPASPDGSRMEATRRGLLGSGEADGVFRAKPTERRQSVPHFAGLACDHPEWCRRRARHAGRIGQPRSRNPRQRNLHRPPSLGHGHLQDHRPRERRLCGRGLASQGEDASHLACRPGRMLSGGLPGIRKP